MRACLVLLALALLAPVAAAEEPAPFDPASPATWPPAAEAGCREGSAGAWAGVVGAMGNPYVGVGGLHGLGAAFGPLCAAGAEMASLTWAMGGAFLQPAFEYVLRVLGA